MKSIPAGAWNALVDRLRRDQVLGVTVLEHGAWKHPWQVTPSWNAERERWTATIQPGFVNGIDAEVRVRAAEAPVETLQRLGLDRHASRDDTVDAWLTEAPPLPLTRWRAIGRDADPVSRSSPDFETVVAAYEPVPEFFLARGAAPVPADLASSDGERGARLLRATDLVLYQDRLAAATEWTSGAGVDATRAQFSVTYRLPPGARERAYLRTTDRHVPPEPPDPLARLRGDWQDPGRDELPLATVYLLSPEDTPDGAEPGPDWTPYVKHHVFWNLVHAVDVDPAPVRRENLTLVTGLAAGIADPIFNEWLATANDETAALAEFLGKRTVEGRFWSV